ncbi:MAG: EamA family transporter [Burkholderiales bacterium]|nr:EamA family transporter [Burkholderiales bacterium]
MSFRSAFPALAAALLFGASTPLAKLLSGNMPPLLLAGLLYLGSGLGLGMLLLLRRLRERHRGQPVTRLQIPRAERPWLLGAIIAGGVLGPALFMLGLAQASAASASLLLNLEGMLTALMAWLVFRENADRRIVLGMLAIVLGGVLLSWEPGGATFSPGALLIAGACLCWALDNNLTRKVSANDALLLACLKGLLAGTANTAIALFNGAVLPAGLALGYAGIVGFLGYGLSLSLFVVALRTLGSARTGAYFSVAPLFGVLISLAIWPDAPGLLFWLSAALMGFGVWLHLSERHAHEHRHEPLRHSHVHRHDAHHRHVHDPAQDENAPHAHEHQHEALAHSHAHYPDIHHRHPH